jgi:hypothetical protein
LLRFFSALALVGLATALAAALVGVPSLALAEATASCKDGAMPFPPTAANQLTGAQLQQAVTGKRLGYVRESIRVPGVYASNTRELRADGSMIYTCTFSRSPNGPWSACKSYGSMKTRREGARDVGVWSIKNNAVCSVHASFGEKAENCVAIHRQGSVLAAVRVSGSRTACIPGTITLQ